MKKVQFKEELKQLTSEQLRGKLDEVRRELFGLRLNSATAHVKDYSLFKKMRRKIACILTIINKQR